MNNILIAPSILSGNFAEMGKDVKNMREVGADWIHVDVMDGVFVPNITFGFKMIKDIRPLSDLTFDVHLMITEPKRYVERFAAAGADIISFHFEAERDIAETIALIKKAGKKAGLAINPDTPVEVVKPFLKDLDLVLIMSVFPGFGGQKFIDGSAERVKLTKKLCADCGSDALVEIDGGINADNAKAVIEAGADVLVAGSAVFGASDRRAAIERLRGDNR